MIGRATIRTSALLLLAGLLTAATPAPVEPPPPQPSPTVFPTPAPAAPPAPGTHAPGGPGPSTPPPVAPASGPHPQALGATEAALAQLRADAAKAADDEGLEALHSRASDIEAQAEGIADADGREAAPLARELREIERRRGSRRTRERSAEERRLAGERAPVLKEEAKAEEVRNAANAVYTQVAARRRARFESKVFTRTASPLETQFWSGLEASLSLDLARAGKLVGSAVAVASDAPEPRGLLSLGAGLLAATLLLFPIRRALERLLRRWPERAGAGGELGSTAHALGAVLLATAAPGGAAALMRLGADWGGLLSPKADALMRALVVTAFWSGAVVALGHRLVTAPDPRDRFLDVPEPTARRVRPFPWAIALVTGLGFLLSQLANVVGASVAASVAANCVISLAYAVVATGLLAAMGAHAQERDAQEARSPATALVALPLTAAIVVTVAAVFAGYTTFAALVSSQIFWVSVLAAATYLFVRFVGDLTAALFLGRGWIGRLLATMFSLRPAAIAQLAVLIAGALQLLVVVGAVSLALTPFGRGGDIVLPPIEGLDRGVRLGSLSLSPRALGMGLAILLLGLMLVGALQRWLERRFLPVTDWDAGVQNSVSTGLRYFGVAAVVLGALSAAGLSFQQLALVASALSVGIGFGLQQVVQNFVAGLILLVERPLKVGDWIDVAGVEGDVRRIRVRSTEIQMFDRTTLIVPNSDLISKAVQNKTLGDPRGRVNLKITVGHAVDAARAVAIVEAVVAACDPVLADPAPMVAVESLTAAGGANLAAFAYVATPREAYRVRSALYLAAVAALDGAGIALRAPVDLRAIIAPPAATTGVEA